MATGCWGAPRGAGQAVGHNTRLRMWVPWVPCPRWDPYPPWGLLVGGEGLGPRLGRWVVPRVGGIVG